MKLVAHTKSPSISDKVLETKTIIIATEHLPSILGCQANKDFVEVVFLHVRFCDGFFYKGQEVAIVGGGDTAAEEDIITWQIFVKR